jgi:LysM repeat protein
MARTWRRRSAALLAVALVVVLGAPTSQAHTAKCSPVHYRVRAGDTLWSIAAAHYGGDPREAVWRLKERNDLPGTLVRPGEHLRLP